MTQAGIVKNVKGTAIAVSKDGSNRILSKGDIIYLNETVITIGQNSSINIIFDSG